MIEIGQIWKSECQKLKVVEIFKYTVAVSFLGDQSIGILNVVLILKKELLRVFKLEL